MSPLEKKVLGALRKRADDLNKVTSDAATVAGDVGSDQASVHQALVQLNEDGYFASSPYFEGTGNFSVRLR